MYTIFFDNYNGIPDDISFKTLEAAEKKFDAMSSVAFKKLVKTTADAEVTLKTWKDEAYWAEMLK